MMANAALVMECKAVIVLQGTAVLLAQQGVYEHVFAAGLPSLAGLIESFISDGGKLLVCSPCAKERQIGQELLIKGTELIAGTRVIKEVTESQATLNY